MSAPPNVPPGTPATTTRLVVVSPSEAVLAEAATAAGLLQPSDRQVLLTDAGGAEAVSGLEDPDVELLVGTSALRSGRALARRWPRAPVVLLAGGASAYGPTSGALAGRLAKRVDRVLHPDLVPGLRPLLLAERSVPTAAVPPEHLRTATATRAGHAGPVPDPTTLVLGRTGAWAGALDRDQQTDLLVAMVERCAEAGHSRLVLLLDAEPSPRTRRHLQRASLAVRADLDVVVDEGPPDAWFAQPGVSLVVGCASEDLLVARRVHGRGVAQLDTDVVLKRLAPFGDPRRTAATLVAATVPDLRTWTSSPAGEALDPVDLAGLMSTVAYAMEPEVLADRRAGAISYLEAYRTTRRRFVRRRRLSELRLPGGKRTVRPTLG